MAGSSVPKLSRGAQDAAPAKGFYGSYSLTIDDHIALDLGKGAAANYLPWFYFAAAILMFASLVVTYPYWRAGDMTRFFSLNGLAAVILLALRWAMDNWLTNGLRRRLEKDLRERGQVGRELEIDIEPSGLTTRLLGTTTTTPWHAFITIEEMEDGPVYFWLTAQEACIWPERLFESNGHRLQLRQAIGDWAGYRPVRPPLLARLTSDERREVANGRMKISGLVDRRTQGEG